MNIEELRKLIKEQIKEQEKKSILLETPETRKKKVVKESHRDYEPPWYPSPCAEKVGNMDKDEFADLRREAEAAGAIDPHDDGTNKRSSLYIYMREKGLC
tara:strand:+ start:850 stop:1149 length:300 start_codon:yes stop_codon:yes gene_type:complete